MREAPQGDMRSAALILVAAGAAGSVGFLVYAARHSPPLLMIMIGSWVLAPFVGLFLADIFSKQWPPRPRKAVYSLTLAVPLCSLVAYGSDFQWPRTPRAAMFVLVPGVSWLVIAAVLSATWLISRGGTCNDQVPDR